jgi:hypothetical protein
VPQPCRRRPTLPGVAISGMIVIALLGCESPASGPSLVPAAGVLMLNGAPVSGATILYAPETGPLAHAVTAEDGQFELRTGGQPGAVAGNGRIAVTSASANTGTALLSAAPPALPTDPLAYASSASQMQIRIAQPPGSAAKGFSLPKKIQRLETSDLILHVPREGSKQLALKISSLP